MFRSTEGSKPARAPERAPEGVAAPARKPPMGSILIAAGRLTPENAALALRVYPVFLPPGPPRSPAQTVRAIGAMAAAFDRGEEQAI